MKTKVKSRSNPQEAVIEALNQLLADALVLKLNAKQAHWNVKGPNFLTLHELFDKVATAVDGYADELAERAVQLGGYAEGTLQNIGRRSSVAAHPANTASSAAHVKAIASQLRALADEARAAIDETAALGDAVTADILTGITGGLDTLRWFVESHS